MLDLKTEKKPKNVGEPPRVLSVNIGSPATR